MSTLDSKPFEFAHTDRFCMCVVHWNASSSKKQHPPRCDRVWSSITSPFPAQLMYKYIKAQFHVLIQWHSVFPQLVKLRLWSKLKRRRALLPSLSSLNEARMRVVYLERFCNKFSYLFWFTWHQQPKGYFVEGLQHSAKLFHIGESRCICCVLSWIFIFVVQDSNAQDEDTWLPVRHPMAVGWMVLSRFVNGQQKHHQQRKVKIHLCLVHGRSIPIVHL